MSKVVFPIFLRGHPQAISQFHERNINNIKSAILTKAHRQSSNRIRRAFGTSPIAGSSNDVITGSLSGAKDLTSLLPPASSGAGRNARGAKLLVSGPDAAGIVASFSQLLYRHGCGIVDCASESSQRDDDGKGVTPSSGRKFFQRILFDHGGLSAERKVVEREVDALCATFGVKSKVCWGDRRRKVAIFVSKYDHCLWELLLRHRAGELHCDIVAVVSNHEDLRPVAETFDVPYHVYPITRETKSGQEVSQLDLLRSHGVDLVVLARYMQILSAAFCAEYRNRIINIHHSFLPAFVGSRPYHQAHERGVKLIGATAHYATLDLDQGPIIEQDITRVGHRDDVSDLIRKGRTLEKNVLVSAVRAHLDERVIVDEHKCIVFSE